MNIVMVAAENGAIEGGKVGGIGDVVRDIPLALAAAGNTVHVVTPGYNLFSKRPGAKLITEVSVSFAGQQEQVQIYTLPAPQKGVKLWVFEHSLFAAGGAGAVYCNDPDNRPFATDAMKFALFCVAVSEACINDVFKKVDVLHLHDWHAAMVAVLAAYDPRYKALNSSRLVYTIHNLSLQGVRPFEGDSSSLKNWFPALKFDPKQIADPRAKDCINPMRAGINLSDRVHAVSPTYATEIVVPSKPEQGYYGGEGLELDLQRAESEERLHGILNGCEYPKVDAVTERSMKDVLADFEEQVVSWLGLNETVDSAHLIALRRLATLQTARSAKSKILVTSVGRITDQKVSLLKQTLTSGESAIQGLLNSLGSSGLLVLLGSGDREFEQFLTKVASTNSNFLFLKGYSEAVSNELYERGDLFLMPSSFEPCGISQMLAMRAGQPCLVHDIGGLSDTVIDNKNGFTFTGNTVQNQADNMVSRFSQVLKIRNQKKWQAIAQRAARERFEWSSVTKQYAALLYDI